MFTSYVLLLLFGFALLVNAQTTTTTDAAGHTIIEVLTTNAQGQTSTRIISTVAGTTATTAATTTTQQGPVATPAPTTVTPGAPTPYTYTTVVNGVTVVTTDVFTPTSPPTISVSPSSAGTVWAYSSWLSIYGPPKTKSSAVGYSTMSSSAALVLAAAVFTRWIWVA